MQFFNKLLQLRHYRNAAGGLSFFLFSAVTASVLLTLSVEIRPLYAGDCASEQGIQAARPGLAATVNPNPSMGDIELPMPCGGKLILIPVCVPAHGYFGDLQLDLGCENCGRKDQGFMEDKYREALSGPFTLVDLPESWRVKVREQAAEDGNGLSPVNESDLVDFYYFIGKYEISNFQWESVMDEDCRGAPAEFSSDDPRPKVGISWFEAVEFTRKYTEWLIKNAPGSLPVFALNRFGYIRLPTEAEWEYAARGGQRVIAARMNEEELFPLNGRQLDDFAVYTAAEAAKPQERLAWIGTKCPNPLGLYDTAGNAAEMVLEPFRFSLGYRLHGAAGGFIIKGGSFRKSRFEVMPGRREEQPFFLGDGAFRSADIGFRVVLSGILTPQNRRERLDQQWREAGLRRFGSRAANAATETGRQMDQSHDPITEIDRLLAASGDEAEKKSLFFLRGVLEQDRNSLKKQEAEAIKGSIRSAILTAESLQDYASRRKVVINGNINLERMKTETMSSALRESLEHSIARARESLRMLDAAVEHFTKFYLDRIKDCQSYPEKLLDRQLDIISQELYPDEELTRRLRNRLDLFGRHVSLYKQKAGDLSLDFIQNDILANNPL